MSKILKSFICFTTIFIIIIFNCVGVSALHTLGTGSSPTYADILSLRASGCHLIEICYNKPFSVSTAGEVFDINHVVIVLNNNVTAGGTLVPTNQTINKVPDLVGAGFISTDEYMIDPDSGNHLDSLFNIIYYAFDSAEHASEITGVGVLYYMGYQSDFSHPGGTTTYLDSYSNLGVTTCSTLSLPWHNYVGDIGDQALFPLEAYRVQNRINICLGDTYLSTHNVEEVKFDNASFGFELDVQSGCSDGGNVCDCDCGYYSEQLKEELIDYFDRNYITKSDFNSFIQQYFENNTTNNYYNNNQSNIYNDYSVIASQEADTEFSSEIGSYKDDQDELFSDLDGYASQLDGFESQLTISPEVSQAAGMITGLFDKLPTSIIVALVFCLVMIVVVKILGR